MQQSSASPKPTVISEFYKRYPYPKVDRVEYDFNLVDHFHYLAKICPAYRLQLKKPQRRGRMLIAGCGTREAVMWGFSLPHFDIDAIDINETSLEISKHLAKQLELTNVNFIHGNFEYGEGINGPYDFIHSYGVLHHLENPERGLAHLEAALAPNGLMSIMVYNDANRIPLQRAQRLIHLLTKDAPKEDKENLSHHLVERGAQTTNRLRSVFQRARGEIKDNPQQFADTMLNPREVSYTIPSLVKFLKSSDLEIVSPALPVHWKAQAHLAVEQQQAFLDLSLIEQMEVCDHLEGPLFWILSQRSSERLPERPCVKQEDLFWNIVPMPMLTGAFPVEQLQLKSPHEIKVSTQRIHQNMVSISRGQGGKKFDYHQVAKAMVDQIDGINTMKEIAILACNQEGLCFEDVEQALLLILHDFIDTLAIATPDFSHCSRCPARCST